MAWNQAVVTNEGLRLAASVTAGNLKLNISSIWFGSGVPSNQATATDLTSKKIKADIIDKRQSGMDCLITFRISNLGQAKAIVLSELGFYATNESGTEVLFSTVIDPNPATLPAKGTNDAEYRQTMTMAFGYSNSDSVTLTPTIVMGHQLNMLMKR